MKAWTFDRYGPPDVLELREVPLSPFKDENEVHVRVRTASLNPTDKHALKPPFLFRRRTGFLRPKMGRLGGDVAGRVEAVGRNVKELRVGDEVFGVGRGTMAEYAVADQSQLALKPVAVASDQAAAIPIAATTALQGLRDKAQVRPDQTVLVNGASGGVGCFAVQIAKSLGAQVSAVCSTQNVEVARSLGAGRVFDYSNKDFTRSGQRYDVIFDTQLNHSLGAYRRVLNPGGVLMAVGAGSRPVGRALIGLLAKVAGSRVVGPKTKFFIASINTRDLKALADLLESGKIRPLIDRSYPFDQVPSALRQLIGGHTRGKIVVNVSV
jgi:NADPH:quinone reductase-like Zn-dependent oxidoreductase